MDVAIARGVHLMALWSALRDRIEATPKYESYHLLMLGYVVLFEVVRVVGMRGNVYEYTHSVPPNVQCNALSNSLIPSAQFGIRRLLFRKIVGGCAFKSYRRLQSGSYSFSS